jgi:hypothetical protein
MPLSAADCRDLQGVLSGKATGWRYTQVARWLRACGFVEHGSHGSHRTWRHPSGRRVPMVDKGKGQLLPVYAKRAAQAILDLGECQ